MTELEKKAIDVIRNHSHKLIDKFTQEDLENREISIFMAGYHEGNKANEWHYPSKGEYPKCDEKTQLIFYVTCYCRDITRKRMVLGYYQKSFMNDDVKLFVEKSKGYEEEHLPKDVIAWKEIVLPKLKEGE